MTATKKTEKTKGKTSEIGASDSLATVKGVVEEVLSMLGVPVTVEVEPGEENSYVVRLETEESGLLIGYHGETLASLQMVVGLIVFRKLGEWSRIVIEVGDYRARREEQLRAMAESYAAQVVATGEPVYLPALPPIERRVVHMVLQDRKDVRTESEGDGRLRRLVIKPN